MDCDPIEAAEREIRRDREDLDRLKRRYPGYAFLPVNGNGSAAVPASVVPERTGIVRRPIAPLSAIEEAVLKTINSEPNEEWTSRGIIMAIRTSHSYRLAENDDAAMNAVGIALASLTEKRKINRVYEGRGRDPHRYRSDLATEKEVPSEEKTS